MSWKRRAEGAYHHGNLREALIQAARELIKEKGPGGFTFADAARSAGVSPAAPYRHFRDREALLADVAREGFQRFEAMLATGWNGGKPDAMTAFNNVGKAYLAFARAEPAYYAAMFESGLPPDLSPDLRASSDRAFAVLRVAADGVVTLLPAGKRPPCIPSRDGLGAQFLSLGAERQPVGGRISPPHGSGAGKMRGHRRLATRAAPPG